MLWNDFRKLDPREGKIIWIENEGNKVGKVHTPQPLRKMITSSSKIFVKPSVDQRVDHIMREYTVGLCCRGIPTKSFANIYHQFLYLQYSCHPNPLSR